MATARIYNNINNRCEIFQQIETADNRPEDEKYFFITMTSEMQLWNCQNIITRNNDRKGQNNTFGHASRTRIGFTKSL